MSGSRSNPTSTHPSATRLKYTVTGCVHDAGASPVAESSTFTNAGPPSAGARTVVAAASVTAIGVAVDVLLSKADHAARYPFGAGLTPASTAAL